MRTEAEIRRFRDMLKKDQKRDPWFDDHDGGMLIALEWVLDEKEEKQ